MSVKSESNSSLDRVQQNISPFSTLLTQYRTLCRYCDDFFDRTFQAFRSQMQCTQGCASCCVLESVVPLEAYVIADYLEHSTPPSTRRRLTDAVGEEQDACVLLQQNCCAIYPVRPIICRTHGIPLQYQERSAPDACPLNFIEYELKTLEPQFVLDAEMITTNLMRLNLAFGLITQTQERSGERISLAALLTGACNLTEIAGELA